MRNKISFGSFFDISSSETVQLLLSEDGLMLLKAAVVVNVCVVGTDPFSVVIS
jgi:hypothetical protein